MKQPTEHRLVKQWTQAIICSAALALVAWVVVGCIYWDWAMPEWSGFARALVSGSGLGGLIVGLSTKPGGFA